MPRRFWQKKEEDDGDTHRGRVITYQSDGFRMEQSNQRKLVSLA
jgi:hypothetical protein